ncbi:hypothetical protein STCU_11152 [Strigomonas culicis]|uniref:Uncharacterized protein n=1 Tax=Strigomonas culicis TaxID=28005 RepID=S9TJL0_9TRYP|nr:hypothetical protein STCU_11152 [Strigomonas culicis]|eukprot:EPY16543.1 hypothetical protein STCU_11152 [Strigomonas culicis]
MNKLLLTTYRKLYRGVAELDRNTAARALLVCSPRERYDYRTTEWRELHVEEVVPWQDSRIFLDRLIRRLNNGSAFYIPPASVAAVADAAAALAAELRHARSRRPPRAQQRAAAPRSCRTTSHRTCRCASLCTNSSRGRPS